MSHSLTSPSREQNTEKSEVDKFKIGVGMKFWGFSNPMKKQDKGRREPGIHQVCISFTLFCFIVLCLSLHFVVLHLEDPDFCNTTWRTQSMRVIKLVVQLTSNAHKKSMFNPQVIEQNSDKK